MLLAVDWSAIGGASTAIGVLVALVAVVVQLVATRRSEARAGQLEQREQAVAAASRSEAAAALTEEYTRRVVIALESMAEQGIAGTVAGAARLLGAVRGPYVSGSDEPRDEGPDDHRHVDRQHDRR